MGDRGGTATGTVDGSEIEHYTRWEIGGEPQPGERSIGHGQDYTRWEIGGEPQQSAQSYWETLDYTRWEIGGEPQLPNIEDKWSRLYPMGDRGGTATSSWLSSRII